MATYVKSDNIFIYPTAHRQSETKVYNPESKLNTEYNVTNQIAQLIGKKSKSFVVDYDTSDADNKILKLCMKGYFIEIQHAEDIMTGDSGLFARLQMINRGDVNYPHLIELCGNGEAVDLDSSASSENSVCYALQILNQTEYDALSSDEKLECLIIKSNGGNYVPADSKTKFSLLDVCNVDESPIISSKDDTAYGFNKVISSQENIITSKDMILGYGGCLSLRGTDISKIHLANENNSLEYSNVINLPVDSGTVVLRDSASDLISYRLPIAASTGNKHNKIANSTIEVLGSQTVGGGIYVREVSGNPINFDSSNKVKIQNNSDSSNTAAGALTVSGGVGIAKKLNVGDVITAQKGITSEDDVEVSYGKVIKLKKMNGGSVTLTNGGAQSSDNNSIILPSESGRVVLQDSSTSLTANRLLIGLDSNKLQNSTLSFSNNTLKNDALNSNIVFDSANKVVINNASTGGSDGYALTVNGTAHVNGLYSDTYINATNGISVQDPSLGVLTKIEGATLETGSISCYNLEVSKGDDGGGSASIKKDLFVGENAFVSGSLEVSGTDVSTKFNSLDTSVTNINTTLNKIRDKKLVRHDFEIQCDWTPTGQNAHRAVVLMTLFDDNDTDYSFTSTAQASVKENFVKRLFDNSNVSTGGGTTHGRRYFASGFISSLSDGDYKALYTVYLLDPATTNVFRLNYYGYLATNTSVTLNPADISHVYDSHKVVLNFNNV